MARFYPGRTRHYHVKVQAPGSRLLTTQLYFPNEPANLRDGLFRRELLMEVADAGMGSPAGSISYSISVRTIGFNSVATHEVVWLHIIRWRPPSLGPW